jgi:hypothetical protein
VHFLLKQIKCLATVLRLQLVNTFKKKGKEKKIKARRTAARVKLSSCKAVSNFSSC